MSAGDEEIDRGWFTTGKPSRATEDPSSLPPANAPPSDLSVEAWGPLRERIHTFEREITASVVCTAGYLGIINSVLL